MNDCAGVGSNMQRSYHRLRPCEEEEVRGRAVARLRGPELKALLMQNGCFKWGRAHEGPINNVQRFVRRVP